MLENEKSRIISIQERHPTKQGLKLVGEKRVRRNGQDSRATSNKTRIETR